MAILIEKGTCAFKSAGRTTKKESEGNTSQNILVVSEDTCSTSFVSKYIQHMASTETSGTDASNAPTNELILETSDIETIKAAVIANLVIYQVIAKNLLMGVGPEIYLKLTISS